MIQLKTICLLLALCSTGIFLQAQDSAFKASVSRDTVLLGNAIRVTFTIENTEGDFSPPEFKDFNIVGGPSQSSSFSMINGHTTQSASYTYYIEPKASGKCRIEAASLATGSGTLKTEPIRILVKENPDGIRENAEPGNRFSPSPRRKPAAPKEEPRPFEKTYKL